MQTTRQWQTEAIGPEADLKISEAGIPEVSGTMVRVRTQAVSLNFRDRLVLESASATKKPIITKLSPNQTDIRENARRCIEAGAWDYVSKPVDPMNLLAVLRGWLCR